MPYFPPGSIRIRGCLFGRSDLMTTSRRLRKCSFVHTRRAYMLTHTHARTRSSSVYAATFVQHVNELAEDPQRLELVGRRIAHFYLD